MKRTCFSGVAHYLPDAVVSSDCRAQVARLAERAQLVRLDVGESGRENLAVTNVEVSDPLITTSRDVTVRAEVQNFGLQDRAQHKVEFVVDGRVVHEQFVDVDAGGQATASMTHRFATPGEHRVEVRLADDALAIDNHRWVSVPVRESIRVLCIEGKTDAAQSIALALEPGKGTRPRVRTRVVSENAIVESGLSDYDCVFLCNVGRFGRDEAEALRDFLQNGGGVVFFLGDQVRSENYNEVLGASGNEQRLLPVKIADLVDKTAYGFDPLGYRHPIVQPFRGHENTGLLNSPVWRYYQLTLYDKSTARVALDFSGGNPAIVEENIGRGRVVVYASAGSGTSMDLTARPPSPWSAFHQWPSFPPIVQEMLTVALTGRAEARNLLVSEDMEGVVHRMVGEVPLVVASPDGSEQRVEMMIDGDDSRWIHGDTYRSGIHEARLGPPVSTMRLYAVNVDTKESDLTRFDADLLPSQFSEEFTTDGSLSLDLSLAKKWPVFQYVLLLLFGLLLLETALAWYFGRVTDS